MKYKQMLKIRKTEKDPQVRDRIEVFDGVISDESSLHSALRAGKSERAGEERRDERDRGRAPSGHGSVMGRQVAQPVPEGGHCRTADPHPLRPGYPTEDLRRDPEGR